MEPFEALVQCLVRAEVRFAVIGVWGANYYAHSGHAVFTTEDRDLFLPLDPENNRRAWTACEASGFELWCGDEPLGRPLDLFLAERVVGARGLVKAVHPTGLPVDLTLVMAGFDFEAVWRERRSFRVEDVEIPVARLRHIVESKAAAGRPKDRLFLATHQDALRQLLRDD